MCKKLINRNLIQRKSRDQKGELCDASEAQQEEARVLFFPSKDSANEKHWTLGLLQLSQLPFLLYKSILLPLPHGDLPESCHGCRLWNAVLGWSHINQFLLEKLLAAYLFQVNKCIVVWEGNTLLWLSFGLCIWHDRLLPSLGRLPIGISFSSSGILSCSFIWNIFLCYLSLSKLLCISVYVVSWLDFLTLENWFSVGNGLCVAAVHLPLIPQAVCSRGPLRELHGSFYCGRLTMWVVWWAW